MTTGRAAGLALSALLAESQPVGLGTVGRRHLLAEAARRCGCTKAQVPGLLAYAERLQINHEVASRVIESGCRRW